MFRELGGFDPRFFLYLEETDLLRRVEESGHEIWSVPAALAQHQVATSTAKTGENMFAGCIAKHYFESRLYYLRKHHGLLLALGTELIEIGLLTIRSLLCILTWRPGRRSLLQRLKGPVLRFPRPA